MKASIEEMLKKAEAEHTELIVLHAAAFEQMNNFKEKHKHLHGLLINSKGKIEGYREILKTLEKSED